MVSTAACDLFLEPIMDRSGRTGLECLPVGVLRSYESRFESSREMSSKWVRFSGPAESEMIEDLKDEEEDFEDLELVSSGGELGRGVWKSCGGRGRVAAIVSEWTRGSGPACSRQRGLDVFCD